MTDDRPTGDRPTDDRAPRDRALGVLREVALTAGAVVGTLCLVFALLGAVADVRALAFTSGSMSPAIRTGDLAVTRPVPVDRLAVGDIVSVFDARGVRVTHRVVQVDGPRQLRLKGDANEFADPLPYRVDGVDLVLFSVPAAGYLLTWSSSPVATLLLGVYLAFLLWVLRPGPARRRPAARHGAAVGGLLLVVGLGVGGPSPRPTAAAFTDAASVTGVSLAAYTVPKPVITNCSAAVGSVTVTWTAVTSPALTYKAVVAETGQTLTVNGSGSTRSAQYRTAQLNINATHTIQITAALPSASSWVSVPANQTVRIALLGLAPSCGATS